jgi:hypothetical protein
MVREVRAWTAVDICQLREDNVDEDILRFIVFRTLPSEIPRLMSQVAAPESWRIHVLFGARLQKVLNSYDLIPVEWYVQREHAILSTIQKKREPWMNRVTMAFEALGQSINLMKGVADEDWVRWTERICREVRFVCSNMARKLKEEGDCKGR